MSIETALIERLSEEPKRNIWFRSDFLDLGGYDPVGRALQQACEKQHLAKVAQGIYARLIPIPSLQKTGLPTSLTELAREYLARRGITPLPDSNVLAYNQNKTTQIPMRRRLVVPGLKRDLTLRYENHSATISTR